MSQHDVFAQLSHRIRFAWGYDGARSAAERGDIIVIVDVLRFTTAVCAAVATGGSVRPCEKPEDGRSGEYSLSPGSYRDLPPGTDVVLWSLNGATCAILGRKTPHLLAGALVNARATAAAVMRLMSETGLPVSVIACGERWKVPGDDGALRFAIEDALGAGAILSGIDGDKSPEARWCEAAFRELRHDLPGVLRQCGSGLELIERGNAADLDHAADLERYDCAAVFREGRFIASA
jgi:2-phosphosulfolactate phosphatase